MVPSTAKNRVSAHRIRNGGRNGSGSVTAACVADTPKIKTGMTSGRISTETSKPPRGNETVTAAPTAPMKVIAGVPTSSVSVAAPMARWLHVHDQAEHRRGDDQRQHGHQPVAQRLGEHGFAHSDNMSWPATIRSSEPSSRSIWNKRSRPSSEARSAPIHRIAGPMRAEQLHVRPDAERDDRDDGKERTTARSTRRFRRARPGGIRGKSARSCFTPDPQFPQAFNAERQMGGGDQDAAGV